MYYDLTWDHGKMRYKCALPKILNYVTSLSFNEFKSIKILFHGPMRDHGKMRYKSVLLESLIFKYVYHSHNVLPL